MNIKLLRLVLVLLLVAIFTSACSGIMPNKVPLNEAIKEILNTKGQDYDFLNDDYFLELVDEYVNSIPDIDKKVQYTIGNLNDDNSIPEIVVFMDRNPDTEDSKVELVVYEFNDDSYVVLDKVDMNYDTSSHLMEIGNISPDEKGIFISNNAGAHSTITYGFKLEDGKLKSILNENKLSLISIKPSNEIKDIDNDGILEFSIYTVNPEADSSSTDEDSMITIWYKWDGKDAANVVMTETDAKEADNLQLMGTLDTYSHMNLEDVIPYLDENLSSYNVYEITRILREYVQRLEDNFQVINQSPLLKEAFASMKEYSISIDSLNSHGYLSKAEVLSEDVSMFILDNLRLGYKLQESEGSLYFIVDNQMFIDKYGTYLTKEYLGYLNIKAYNSNEPYLKDGSFAIDRDKLSERIISIESFKLKFPYSSFISELNSIYSEYVKAYILGSINTPNYDPKTNMFSDGSISLFKEALNQYKNTHFAEILDFVIHGLESNFNILNAELKEGIEEII